MKRKTTKKEKEKKTNFNDVVHAKRDNKKTSIFFFYCLKLY